MNVEEITSKHVWKVLFH